MRYLKMLATAAVAVAALAAVMAASASANAQICSPTHGNGPACANAAHGKQYDGPVTASLTTGKTAKLVSGFITVSCTSSTAGGTVAGATGTGSLTSLTFAGCTSGLGACTAKTSASAANPWPVTVTTHQPGIVDTNGIMHVSNITGEFTCAGITCKYVTSKASPTVDGSQLINKVHTTAEITAANIPLTLEAGSSGFCSANATWSGEYLITTPDSLVVV